MAKRQVVPEALALMAPGPELAVALAGIDLTAISGFDVVEVLKARQRQLSHDHAMFFEAVVESGARSDAECRAPASSAQIDHTVRWADDGPTSEPNLGAGCAHDHRLKDEGGWVVIQLAPGRFHWTSRLGHHYQREREPVIEPMPEPNDRMLPPQWTPPERDHDPQQMLADSRPPPEPEIIERPEPDHGDPPF